MEHKKGAHEGVTVWGDAPTTRTLNLGDQSMRMKPLEEPGEPCRLSVGLGCAAGGPAGPPRALPFSKKWAGAEHATRTDPAIYVAPTRQFPTPDRSGPDGLRDAKEGTRAYRPPWAPCRAECGGKIIAYSSSSRADIEPDFPDWLVSISDVTSVLDAFRGLAYPPDAFADPQPPPWERDGECYQ
ncbi:MAG: hypothetical protein JSU86_01245 [Phycisphaerales bacterium]|nr:MAG: hypothetical protein JSU86_01245 [Phycisphaerales bacterium]